MEVSLPGFLNFSVLHIDSRETLVNIECTTVDGMTNKIPQSKILVAFASNQVDGCPHRAPFLQSVFGLRPSEAQNNIVKDLHWRTKYYERPYDLFIDEFEDFEEWLAEFCSPDYDELREVLEGIIVITDYDLKNPLSDRTLQKYANSAGRGSFVVWCNTKTNDEQEYLSANRIMCNENPEAEMVTLHCDQDVNEYGERLGLMRLKEVIDIHEWDGVLTSSRQLIMPQ